MFRYIKASFLKFVGIITLVIIAMAVINIRLNHLLIVPALYIFAMYIGQGFSSI